VNTSSKSTRSRRPGQVAASAQRDETRRLGASESERHCQPRSSCRVPLRRMGCRECAGLWNGRQIRQNICARVDCIARSKSARPGADGLWDPPGRRTLRHTTCSKVVTCFARLGLAELMRSVVPTGRRLADRQALHRGSSARRAVALKTIFPRVGSGKDNALWQSLGHIRCMARRRDCERLAWVCRILSGSALGIGVLWAIVRRPPLLSP